MDIKKAFEILGIDSPEQAEQSLRFLRVAFHPDKFDREDQSEASRRFKLVNEAGKMLCRGWSHQTQAEDVWAEPFHNQPRILHTQLNFRSAVGDPAARNHASATNEFPKGNVKICRSASCKQGMIILDGDRFATFENRTYHAECALYENSQQRATVELFSEVARRRELKRNCSAQDFT